MPKAKPSLQGGVIVHRIELQEKERDMLETLVVGKTVKNVVVPVAITAGVGAASYIGYKYAKATVDWGTDFVDDVKTSYGVEYTKKFMDSPLAAPIAPAWVLGRTIFQLFTTGK